MEIDFIKDLNEQQQAAVRHLEGPVVIIAGAGSGKTRVLTYRIAYSIAKQVAEPHQILALTFTNKAAKEMQERIHQLIGSPAKSLWMGTFHSIFAKILRFDADKIGFTNNFTIYDADDSANLVKKIISELGYDEKVFKHKSIYHKISAAKNHLVQPTGYLAFVKFLDAYEETTAKVYAAYQMRLLKANAMDFDDLLTNTVKLFSDHPEILYRYQNRFRYILVDEYQDTNHAQYVITKKLAAIHQNICVVGDDAQSIYSFRGADIRNILHFQQDYSNAVIFKLEQNYRSTDTIVQVANAVIRHNKAQIPKLVFTQNEPGEKIRLMEGNSEQNEAAKVVEIIRELKLSKHYNNRDFAILYRTNAQSRVLEDALRRAGILYKVFGGLSFYRRKEIKDMLAYMRLAVNPKDEESLLRIINYPKRGIGETIQQKLIIEANKQNLAIWELLNMPALYEQNWRGAKTLEAFITLVSSFQVLTGKKDAYEVTRKIAQDTGILKELNSEDHEIRSKYENVQELINATKEFVANDGKEGDTSLDAFMQEVSLATDFDQDIENPNIVSLMTVHSAKGLEFPVVFIVGLEEGLFPSAMSAKTKEDIEEERRLFYVAVTRSCHELILSYARSRLYFGTPQFPSPSRFIDEIDPKQIQKVGRTNLTKSTDDKITPKTLPQNYKPVVRNHTPQTNKVTHDYDDNSKLAPNMQVFHEQFGKGLVRKIEGSNEDRRAFVDFGTRGQKTLLLKYAKLKILSD